MNSSRASGSGFGLATVLTIIFFVLKITETIDWSWWWVFSPLWISAGLVLILLIIFLIIAIVAEHKQKREWETSVYKRK